MATPIPAKAVLEFTPRPRTLPRLVVVDADLPGAEARFALVHEIARHRPDLCLIALSAGPAPGPGTLPEGVRFAAKPLGPALARAVWDALEHRPEGDGRL